MENNILISLYKQQTEKPVITLSILFLDILLEP